jgi:protein ImuA
MEVGPSSAKAALSLGDPRLDRVFPAGGLPLGCWHEVAGEGPEIETAAVTGAFVAALAGALAKDQSLVRAQGGSGVLVWVMRRGDLYAPGLAAFDFPADRLIQVETRDGAQALAALEDALGSAGVAAAIGEVGTIDLTAGRRLQLACERRGATGFVIRRQPFGGPLRKAAAGASREPSQGLAAATRWSVASAPSEPGVGASGSEIPGLGRPRWRVALKRCRGGRQGSWIVEMNDGAHPLRVVAELGDRQLEASQPWRLAV